MSTNPTRCPLAPENDLVDPPVYQFFFGKRTARYRAIFTVEGNRVLVLHSGMPKRSLCKSAARSCSLVVAVSYCIAIGIWAGAVPPGAFGLTDDGIAFVAGRMAVFPVVCGPLAGLTAGVLMAVDQECCRSWWVVGTMILGLVVPLVVPAIASS